MTSFNLQQEKPLNCDAINKIIDVLRDCLMEIDHALSQIKFFPPLRVEVAYLRKLEKMETLLIEELISYDDDNLYHHKS